MHWQKFQADNIFDGEKLLPKEMVVICDDEGRIEEIVDSNTAGDDVQVLKGIISPGFINCHCHLELSHMKGLIAEKTGLVDFVFSIVIKRHFPEEEIYDAIEKAEGEMLKNGIVAVGDICNNLLTFPQKSKNNLHYYNFIESSGWLPDIANSRIERSRTYFDAFKEIASSSIVPHAPYSVSDNLWKLIQPYFENKVVSIHNQETNFEDELFIQNSGDFVRMYKMMNIDTSFYKTTGKSSLQSYFAKLQKAAQVILVHNTFTQQADIDFVKNSEPAKNVSFCLCPNANLYIENALPPIELLLKNDCRIVLGTDSLASNHSLSILDEMKTIQQHFPSISLEEMLRWSTLNGAKALQMDDMLGSLEQGKKPGLVLIENVAADELTNASAMRRLF